MLLCKRCDQVRVGYIAVESVTLKVPKLRWFVAGKLSDWPSPKWPLERGDDPKVGAILKSPGGCSVQG